MPLGGSALGVVYFAGVKLAGYAFGLGLQRSEVAFYLVLLPVRMGEWLLFLWWFFARAGLDRHRWVGYSAVGSTWSYLLDVPAILAMFVIPGGAWIC